MRHLSRSLTFFLILLMFYCPAQSQTDIKTELTDEQITHFEKDLRLKCRLFFESVLNILDDDLETQYRYDARYALMDLFATSNSSVTDFLALTDRPVTLNISAYSQRLFELELNSPIVDKTFKFSDSIYITSSTMGIRSDYLNLGREESQKRMFRVYKGSLFYLERFRNSEVIDMKRFDVDDQVFLKRISFRISHNQSDNYEIRIERINFVDKRNANVDYNKHQDEILGSTQPWSNQAEVDYLAEIESEALANGILIDVPAEEQTQLSQDEIIEMDSIRQKAKDLEYVGVNIADILVPGLGHRNFVASNQTKYYVAAYGGLFLGAVGWAVGYRLRSDCKWRNHDRFPDGERKYRFKVEAEQNSLRSRIGVYTAVGVLAANAIHVLIRNGKKKSIIRSYQDQTKLKLQIHTNDQIGLGLALNL